ncbi:50S ribosomal protein L31 [Candidatus Peregrinibacteria bacterium CG10_big_fil_rev_8_21_14_0_10_55_24]|nr:MAG: 50S ribosomal protein L31 [Candidatus Peregrinibacteria bacterium CG10_big_fil_rev_8_21_14_0_10_55_24]
MKQGIHPQVHGNAKATCSTCGAVFVIPSTMKEITVETCSKCHPVYTGEQRKELKGGRVERFRKRMAKSKK